MHRGLGDKQVISLGIGMLRALEELWQLRPPVCHGALAPGHVLVDWPPAPDGTGVWLVGVGGRERVRDSLLAEGYLPPASSAISSGSLEEDIYGVGAVLLRLVSGYGLCVLACRLPLSPCLLL